MALRAVCRQLQPAVQVRLAMEELGPTFVKLGQILAGRSDLFGPEWVAEFSKLHNAVPAVPLEQLRPPLSADLGGEPEAVFAWFDPEPLAAASIAQVHRARLQDGCEVVVKIRRPGISAVIEADLAAECRNAERIAANLKHLDNITIPRVHWQHTGARVNVQDYVEGVPGDQLEWLTPEAGFDRALLARRGAHAMLHMIVRDGLFHADPHPGNVFYLPDNRIAFIDFGVGDQIDRAASRLSMALLIAALVVGSSIVMNVQGGPTLFGLPLFGFLGFAGAVVGGAWLLRSIASSGRSGDDDDGV